MAFLGLTWWIWASQVLYNVRYRQGDWLHHLFIILQLLIFCSLAAFAGGFDIGQGIVPDDTAETSLESMFASSSTSFISGTLTTENERSNFLSRVNSTGISTVMALSRIVLIVQYARGASSPLSAHVHGELIASSVYSCASHKKATEFMNESIIHIITLAASSVAYVVAIIVVRTDDPDISLDHSVTKVVLWILPLLWEMLAHVYVNRNNVCYPASEPLDSRSKWLIDEANAILTRADVVFLILLGAG
jgi:hypothetical protein